MVDDQVGVASVKVLQGNAMAIGNRFAGSLNLGATPGFFQTFRIEATDSFGNKGHTDIMVILDDVTRTLTFKVTDDSGVPGRQQEFEVYLDYEASVLQLRSKRQPNPEIRERQDHKLRMGP